MDWPHPNLAFDGLGDLGGLGMSNAARIGTQSSNGIPRDAIVADIGAGVTMTFRVVPMRRWVQADGIHRPRMRRLACWPQSGLIFPPNGAMASEAV